MSRQIEQAEGSEDGSAWDSDCSDLAKRFGSKADLFNYMKFTRVSTFPVLTFLAAVPAAVQPVPRPLHAKGDAGGEARLRAGPGEVPGRAEVAGAGGRQDLARGAEDARLPAVRPRRMAAKRVSGASRLLLRHPGHRGHRVHGVPHPGLPGTAGGPQGGAGRRQGAEEEAQDQGHVHLAQAADAGQVPAE